MQNRRVRLTARCAVAFAAMCSPTLQAEELTANATPAATAPQSRDATPRSSSYWYRIPRRAVELTQSVYAVSADRLMQLSTTTSLERLRDCEASHGLSLMTLWEFRSSTLSLQAGRNGEPTLRWSSRSMHRDEATRGLLDALVHREPDVLPREPAWQLARN